VKSTDERDVVSGARTLHGSVKRSFLVGLSIRRIALSAAIRPSRCLPDADLTGPVGDLTVRPRSDIRARPFLTDFSKGAGLEADRSATSLGTASDVPATMNISAAIEADRAVFGALAIERVQGRARITRTSVTVDPVTFQVFCGQYDGALELTLSDASEFTLASSVAYIEIGELARSAVWQPHRHLSGRIVSQPSQ
jgi:hypothetical protein